MYDFIETSGYKNILLVGHNGFISMTSMESSYIMKMMSRIKTLLSLPYGIKIEQNDLL